jgi:hypothetical protein
MNRELENQGQPNIETRNKASGNKVAAKQEAKRQLAMDSCHGLDIIILLLHVLSVS